MRNVSYETDKYNKNYLWVLRDVSYETDKYHKNYLWVLRDVSYETDKYHKNYLWILCRSCDQGAALGVDSRTELRRISSTG